MKIKYRVVWIGGEHGPKTEGVCFTQEDGHGWADFYFPSEPNGNQFWSCRLTEEATYFRQVEDKLTVGITPEPSAASQTPNASRS